MTFRTTTYLKNVDKLRATRHSDKYWNTENINHRLQINRFKNETKKKQKLRKQELIEKNQSNSDQINMTQNSPNIITNKQKKIITKFG